MSKDSFILLKKKKAIQYYSENNIDKAEKYLKQVCQKSKRDGEAWYLLGLIYGQKGNHSDAEKHFRHVIQLEPNIPETYVNLAVSFNVQAKYNECVELLEGFLQKQKDDIDALINISIALLALNKPEQVISYAKHALLLDNSNPATHEALASAYGMLHLTKDAIEEFELAIKLDSRNLITINNYAKLLLHENDYEGCITLCKKALAIDSTYSPARSTLSSAYIYKGDVQKSLAETASNEKINTGYLFYLNYDETISPEDSYLKHKDWGDSLQYPTKYKYKKNKPHNSQRPIRIGYVSPDFRLHSVAFFLEPLLNNHNKNDFEIFCYSNVRDTDEVTERFKNYADHWREIYRLNINEIVKLIKNDEIDILIDLSGHTEGSRINIFIDKPAPIQITYLGYPSTTGLKTMDYRLVDNITDPSGFEKYTTEKLLRIPGCFLCYSNKSNIESNREHTKKSIVFGSFNHLPKINSKVIETWASILHQVTDSKLMLKNKSFSDQSVCQSYINKFEEYGIPKDRVILVGRIKNIDDHLLYYDKIDIALDTFPYNGTTTTCEALWMSVPVICFSGDRHASRVSSSILKSVGLNELVANNIQEYIEKAVSLANNNQQLKKYHSSIHEIMLDSPLCDEKSFAIKIENIYQELYQNNHNTNQDKPI